MASAGWVWLDMGGERVLAFCYTDAQAGPSAKGAALGAKPTPEALRAAVERPDRTFRRPAQFGARALTPAELAALGLPEAPPWLEHYRPAGGEWRSDPALARHFHPDYPDDLQVLVHDGEPRRTGRAPEACWVRVTGLHAVARVPGGPSDPELTFDPAAVVWHERAIYRATLLNRPHQLQTIAQGDPLLFVAAKGLPHPLRVTEAYLAERPLWAVVACNRCGADEALDPPTTMARLRFPDAPEGSEPVAFTAFCPCGGTMTLARVDAEG
jgi:hypothetical protein